MLKVMFLSTVGVPQRVFFVGEEIVWDGKIGLWPFIEITKAKRDSILREKGADVIECLSVDVPTYRDFMLRHGGVAFDAIRTKMPWLRDAEVVVRRDGAPGHNGKRNLEPLKEAGLKYGRHIVMSTQPPQSPDCNKNDLSFFNSLQHRADELKEGGKTLKGLINRVTRAYSQ